MSRRYHLLMLPLLASVQPGVIKPAAAATGQLTLKVSPRATVTKSSNISGPSAVSSNATATYTATFPSFSNNQSGELTVDVLTNFGSGESLCEATFVTVVSNNSCSISLNNGPAPNSNSQCSAQLTAVNHQTCDFSASFTDLINAPPASGGGGGGGDPCSKTPCTPD